LDDTIKERRQKLRLIDEKKSKMIEDIRYATSKK
jgi:hypothetical protein